MEIQIQGHAEDTIAAIATPMGTGGIAIIRVSGAGAEELSKRVFSKRLKDHLFTYGHILGADGEPIDEGMAVLMRAPRSYTREDVLEIHCHGGVYLARQTLARCLESGARPAQPGEFTKRAFLNGRVDLTRAQAVMDMIAASGEAAAKAAMSRLDGSLYKEVQRIEQALLHAAARLEAFLDYPDDDLDEVTAQYALNEIKPVAQKLESEILLADTGRKQREGIKVAIIGAPNVGKSTLFNALLRDDRAIVSDIPGTTRDTLSESIELGGQLFLFTDTAGLRDSPDPVEQKGVERARKAIAEADILLLCVDPTEGPPTDAEPFAQDERVVVLHTKADQRMDKGMEPRPDLSVSAVTGENIHELSSILMKKARIQPGHTPLLTHEQDVYIMKTVLENLRNASIALTDGMLDCAVLDIRSALATLGEMTGTEDEAVIDLMFSTFCLGK